MTNHRELALGRLHRHAGATFTTEASVRVPAHYGDPEAERRTLESGLALWDGSASDRLELLGPDRHRFLNGMVTADIETLEAGGSCYGLFTNVKGRILADATFVAHADRLWIRLPPGEGSGIREHLEKYVITDRVEILPLADMVPLVLAGPLLRERLASWLGGEAPPAGATHRRARLFDTEVCLLGEERLGTDGVSIWVSASVARMLVTAMLEAEGAPSWVGREAIERLRVERGVPRFGAEITAETFPQEAGVDAAVSYTKGCYLGQEVVARIHYRGGVNRRLVRFEASESAMPEPGQTVVHDARQAGHVTSVARPLDGQGWRGMLLLAVRACEAGTLVELEGGSEARVLGPVGEGEPDGGGGGDGAER